MSCLLLTACVGMQAADPDIRSVDTGQPYPQFVARLQSAIRGNGMQILEGACGKCGIRTIASPAEDALIITVSHHGLMLKMLQAGAAMGAEPPLRFYISRNQDGTAHLTYHQPSAALAFYKAPGRAPIGKQLDRVFTKITTEALS